MDILPKYSDVSMTYAVFSRTAHFLLLPVESKPVFAEPETNLVVYPPSYGVVCMVSQQDQSLLRLAISMAACRAKACLC